MDNQRNMVLAIVLSALVLIGWTALADRFFPQPKPGVTAPKVQTAPASAPIAAAPVRQTVAQALSGAPRVTIETPRLQGSINLKGAVIDDLVLLSHKETIKKNSPPVRLLAPANATASYFAGFGWSGDGLAAPNANTVWQADAAALTPEKPVTLRWDNAAGQRFTIRISVDSNYLFSVEQRMENGAASAVGARPYGFISRLGKSKDPSSWTNHVGPIGAFNGAVNYKVNWDDIDPATGQRFQSKGGWIGFGDHYWLTALIPDQASSIDAGFRSGNGSYQAEFAVPQVIVGPGKAVSTTSRLFAGAKEVNTLDAYEEAGVPLFDKAIDWGWFEIIEKPIFQYLDWLFKLVGNFGVAIILLTLTVRGLMFPIAQRQFASMAAMRVVQPKLKALQERYKDDKPKLQQEMMALYQKEKINPMAGCLPIFLQIPVFYALYKVLMLTIEMRHQPFALWIHDLSAPDPATIINLFGLLNFTPPTFLALGIFPVLLGITMWLQFKLNPAPMDPIQQQMFSIMPWIMMFMMAPFAAGLQLYWIMSNILTIAQQKWLYSRHPALKDPVKA
ncbi:membrane protein insertase YidC [Aquisediminimonas profunda]|uniref:membrane protein insertase YidC n=1 Tax=Aquisediminimonas profunda TaxID=1550733 RepID=UPI001C63174E|nr:membrane protein insertase YidC [Aquisediminimonas profunda]